MMNSDALILVTNDDGVGSKGIRELIKCLKGLGEVVVFAPDGPRSGMSGAITSTQPITYSLKQKEDKLTIYTCTGTPVDCVKLALNEVLDRLPDLLISGINHGGNHAISIHYSGTMGAAMEGCIFHVPSFGVSLMTHAPDADFTEACRLAALLAEKVLKDGLPHGTYLNLNVPVAVPVKGIAVCRQADGQWINEFDIQKDADGKTTYWMQGDYIDHEPINQDNDTYRLNEGYASLVPCTIDATNHAFMDTLKQWNITDL